MTETAKQDTFRQESPSYQMSTLTQQRHESSPSAAGAQIKPVKLDLDTERQHVAVLGYN